MGRGFFRCARCSALGTAHCSGCNERLCSNEFELARRPLLCRQCLDGWMLWLRYQAGMIMIHEEHER